MKYYVIDAFTDQLFKGNPAGVCLPDSDLPDEVMQRIAFENNLAETAFLRKRANFYSLRWFTPEVEIDLCGHATLACAHVVMRFLEPDIHEVSFETKSGALHVTRSNDVYTMNFPSRPPTPVEAHPLLERALGCEVLGTYLSRDLLVLVQEEHIVKGLSVNIDLLREINNDIGFGIIVTAKGSSCDFVSRFFAPNAGVPEDPVTGSAHSTLIPFWSGLLGKTVMTARQLSQRGGTLLCENMGERVNIGGKAICYLSGEIVCE